MTPLLGPEVPVTCWEGDALRFVWPSRGMTAEVDHIVDERADTWAEVTYYELVDGEARHLLGPSRINLLSDGVPARLARHVATMSFATTADREQRQQDLHIMTAQVQTLAMREHRRPPAPVNLAEVPVADGPPPFLLPPLLPERAPTVVVANGGGGKSYLALSIGLALAGGRALPGLINHHRAPLKVVYLDWEANAHDHARRLRQLARGFGLPTPPSITYWHVDDVLTKATWLRAALARETPDLVVVDSIAYAMGGDIKEAGAATAMFRAVGTWNTSVLLAHHENRDGGFYGTTFIRNSARSFWLMESVQTGQALRLVLTHDKFNNGALQAQPIGLRLQFDDTMQSAQWHRHDVVSDGALLAKLPAPDRLAQVLRATVGGLMEVDALAERLGLSERTVKDTAKERPGQFTLSNTQGGRGLKAVVALAREPNLETRNGQF